MDRRFGERPSTTTAEPPTASLGSDPVIFRIRAERQASAAIALSATLLWDRRARTSWCSRQIAEGSPTRAHARQCASKRLQWGLIALVVADLLAFGYDLNPAIPPSDDRPDSDVIAYLRREVPPPLRESCRSERSCRRTCSCATGWPTYATMTRSSFRGASPGLTRSMIPSPTDRHRGRVAGRSGGPMGRRSIERLQLAGVGAIVGASPPPEGVFRRVDRVGRVWIARLDSLAPPTVRDDRGAKSGLTFAAIVAKLDGRPRRLTLAGRPRWTDGPPQRTRTSERSSLPASPPDRVGLTFRYDPPEVRIAAWVSLLAIGLIGVIAVVERTGRKSRNCDLERAFAPG